MNTHESYVSLETAKLLKQAGFDWETIKAYGQDEGLYGTICISRNFNAEKGFIAAPSLAVAQKWLREIRHRSIEVKSFVDGTVDNRGKWWIWHVYDFNPPIDWVLLMSSDCRYSTYEEAQEASIKKALEIILEKGE